MTDQSPWSYDDPLSERDGALLGQNIPKIPTEPTSQPAVSSRNTIILIPHRDEKDYRAWREWWRNRLIKPTGTQWLEARGLDVVPNRTGLAEQALETACEFFLFLDDDVEGSDDLLVTLLSHNLPIVCGWYITKKQSGDRCVSAWIKDEAAQGYRPIGDKQSQRLIQVDVTGMGCALIHRSIFEKLSKPWFYWDWKGPSEDFYFFDKISKELNIKPVIDMEMKCKHYGAFTLEPDGSFNTCGL